MTYKALVEAIANLVEERREAHGNPEKQAKINKTLDKLYDKQNVMLDQMQRGIYKENENLH